MIFIVAYNHSPDCGEPLISFTHDYGEALLIVNEMHTVERRDIVRIFLVNNGSAEELKREKQEDAA